MPKMPGKVTSMMSTGLTDDEKAELEALRQKGGLNPQAALSEEEIARYADLESREEKEEMPMMAGNYK